MSKPKAVNSANNPVAGQTTSTSAVKTAAALKKLDDTSLVSMYKEGNQTAFRVLVDRHKSKVYSTIMFKLKDSYTSEDLAQEVFVKLSHAIHDGRYNEKGTFAAWVCQVARNMAIDELRKRAKRPTIFMEDGGNAIEYMHSTNESFLSKQEAKDDVLLVRELIKRLPDAQREVLLMRQYYDMSFQEIAEATGVSINTALGRMRYAMQNLKKELFKYQKNDQNVYPR